MRCFIALELPPAIRATLGATVERLRAAAPRADVRWIDPDSMHLTLRFLGEVHEQRLDALGAAMREVTSRHLPIGMQLTGLGTFPGPVRPRVVWAGLASGVAEAGALATALDRAVVGLGIPPESRPFRAHVTLGRVKSPRGVSRIVDAIRGASAELGSWTASEAVLFRSHLSPRGARYEALVRAPLGGGAREDDPSPG